jgi:hypothetical protein
VNKIIIPKQKPACYAKVIFFMGALRAPITPQRGYGCIKNITFKNKVIFMGQCIWACTYNFLSKAVDM